MIDSFRGKYRFLSNFYPSPVKWASIIWPTVENAYQAGKIDHPWDARTKRTYSELAEAYKEISLMTPGEAKKVGKALMTKKGWKGFHMKKDWHVVQTSFWSETNSVGWGGTIRDVSSPKDRHMHFLLKQKFNIPELRDMLLATGDEELVEGNTWGDTYWGACNGVGENKLGKMLMDFRKAHRDMKNLFTNAVGEGDEDQDISWQPESITTMYAMD